MWYPWTVPRIGRALGKFLGEDILERNFEREIGELFPRGGDDDLRLERKWSGHPTGHPGLEPVRPMRCSDGKTANHRPTGGLAASGSEAPPPHTSHGALPATRQAGFPRAPGGSGSCSPSPLWCNCLHRWQEQLRSQLHLGAVFTHLRGVIAARPPLPGVGKLQVICHGRTTICGVIRGVREIRFSEVIGKGMPAKQETRITLTCGDSARQTGYDPGTQTRAGILLKWPGWLTYKARCNRGAT